jgi:diguanylate cyclase (GGDEF)-like protein
MTVTDARHARWLLIALAVSASPIGAAAQLPESALLQLETLQHIPAAGPVTIQPRLLSAYAALVAAAMLGVLYLYRGRAFIVYWIGGWLLVAAAFALVSRSYADATLGRALTGLALLLGVWSAGLVLLAALAFPQNALRWSHTARLVAGSAVWFLVTPFVLPFVILVASGTVASSGLLGWAAVRYLHLAHRSKYAGGLLIGTGLGVICVSNVAGIVLAIGADDVRAGQLGAINVVTCLFVALGMHLLVFEDMTEELRITNRDLASANEEVKRLAITDPLTGCHNRRFFEEIERREMQRHRRYSAPLSVVFVDVNHFKQLNDAYGHDRGDETLRVIGNLLRRQVRESDYVIRWGGDEFLLLLSCGAPEARAKAEELKTAFERERVAASLPDQLGLSIGVAAVTKEAESLRDAIREADAGMYHDKLGGSPGPPAAIR